MSNREAENLERILEYSLPELETEMADVEADKLFTESEHDYTAIIISVDVLDDSIREYNRLEAFDAIEAYRILKRMELAVDRVGDHSALLAEKLGKLFSAFQEAQNFKKMFFTIKAHLDNVELLKKEIDQHPIYKALRKMQVAEDDLSDMMKSLKPVVGPSGEETGIVSQVPFEELDNATSDNIGDYFEWGIDHYKEDETTGKRPMDDPVFRESLAEHMRRLWTRADPRRNLDEESVDDFMEKSDKLRQEGVDITRIIKISSIFPLSEVGR